MWRYVLFALLGAVLAGNGLHMLAAPEHWYRAVPGVPGTGPLNVHFVRDIGCAYLAAATGVACAALRREWRVPGLSSALVFVGAHAGVHLWERLGGHGAHGAAFVDHAGIFGPPLLLLALLVAGARRAPGVGGAR
ncbi:MAG: hypothetical protein AB7Q97_25425 [Gammaproteobacteria bacterium]